MKWISITESLPNEGEVVDVLFKNLRLIDFRFEGGKWKKFSKSEDFDCRWVETESPSHWMRVPKPTADESGMLWKARSIHELDKEVCYGNGYFAEIFVSNGKYTLTIFVNKKYINQIFHKKESRDINELKQYAFKFISGVVIPILNIDFPDL